MSANLATSGTALCDAFDVALLDLDGVVYIAGEAVSHAVEALADARERGMRLAYVTNNAARPAAEVARHLAELGIDARAQDVITSAQAGAHELARRLPPGAHVLLVGTTGLQEALEDAGLVPVTSADDDVQAVVQGYSPTLSWRELAEGSIAISRGVLWLATNLDATVPSPRGRVPGNGSMVAALRHATGRQPDLVAGKPDPTMHRETVERTGARNPLVVGDRIDTDLAGAAAVGCPSLLVLTGVTDPAEVLECPPDARPSFLAPDLRGLLRPHPEVTADRGGARGARDGDGAARVHCGPWRVLGAPDGWRLAHDPHRSDGTNEERGDGLDALRTLAVAAWRAHDAGVGDFRQQLTAGDDRAADELARLGLA